MEVDDVNNTDDVTSDQVVDPVSNPSSSRLKLTPQQAATDVALRPSPTTADDVNDSSWICYRLTHLPLAVVTMIDLTKGEKIGWFLVVNLRRTLRNHDWCRDFWVSFLICLRWLKIV